MVYLICTKKPLKGLNISLFRSMLGKEYKIIIAINSDLV